MDSRLIEGDGGP